MAFTGVAVVKQISDRKVRITGLSLVALAAGTISLPAGTGAVKLPSGFQPKPYAYGSNLPGGSQVTMSDSVQVSMVPDAAVATAIPVEVQKSGNDHDDFLITLTNNHATLTSPELEIYIEFH